MKNFYKDLLEQLKMLVEKKEWSLVLDLIDAELKVPFVPTEVEKELIRIREIAKINFIDSQPDTNLRKNYTFEELLNMLDYQNSDKITYALSAIAEKPLVKYINEIRDFFWNIDKPQDVKKQLALLLNEQKVDAEFVIDEFTFNPAKFKNIIDSKWMKEQYKEIISSTLKEPIVGETATSILFEFCFEHFLEYNDNPKEIESQNFAQIAIEEARRMLSEEQEQHMDTNLN